ncbi:MAG: phage holin family protein [Rhodoluna sp.]|nr:phage holin family protein [Rhodoluna sp.]
MKRFLVGTVINCLGLWLVTFVIPAIKIAPWGGETTWNLVASFVFVGMIFGLVTAIVAPVIKVLAFPLYILTFGLISVLINGAMLLMVAWLSSAIKAGVFSIDGASLSGVESAAFGWAILGALIMSIFTFFARAAFKAMKLL